MVDLIITDFDGVILDSFEDQFNWFKHICNLFDKPFSYKTLNEFKKVYVEPVYPNLYEFLGFNWDDEKEKSLIWEEYHKHKSKGELKIFENIDKVIEEISTSGKILALASSNTHSAMEPYLKKFGLSDYFKSIVSREDLPKVNGDSLIKPHPVCLLITLKRLNVEPQNAVYIGDHTSDFFAARNVGAYCDTALPMIAVSYGYSLKEDFIKLGQNKIADNPLELLSLIK